MLPGISFDETHLRAAVPTTETHDLITHLARQVHVLEDFLERVLGYRAERATGRVVYSSVT